MVLNKPKFMKPSTNKEECTIDITADAIPFSCIVDGNESVNAWQIVIYDITKDKNNIVFDSGKITLESSFYPVDEKNRNVVFLVNLKDYIPEDNDKFINRPEAYYWTITLWGSSGCSTTSYQEVFYANKAPNIGFNLSEGDTITSKDYTFRATYGQEDGVQLKRYGWRITDTDSGQVFIDTITKNQIYGSSDNIICNYDGFLNGGSYTVELFVETQNNAKIISSPLPFSVAYTSTFLSNDFKVETLKNEPAIMLDWSDAVVIAGVLKDADDNIVSVQNTTFKTNYPVEKQCSIKIPDKSKVVYDYSASLNLDISEDSYIAFSTQLLSDSKTILFSAEGSDKNYELKRQLSYDAGEFEYFVVGRKGVVASATYKVKNRPSEYVWYNILMSPLINSEDDEYSVSFEVFESKVVDYIYPREDLYPKESFYPVFGKWVKEE